jgi:hypothetical protein
MNLKTHLEQMVFSVLVQMPDQIIGWVFIATPAQHH